MENSSFRQAGKEVFGKICKGSIIDAYNRCTQPSIPSKSESLLKSSAKKEAFGSSASRFTIKTSKLPGPGAYSEPFAENPSLSKKGYGGLTNSAPRFKRFQYVSLNPGPGSYEQKSESSTPGFTITLGKTRSLKKVQEMPAPGQYEVVTSVSTKESTSMFKSTSKRMEVPNKESPAPWQYTPNYNLTRSSSSALTSVFKRPTMAKRYEGNIIDQISPSLPLTTPGPGDYNVESTNENARPSSMFIHNNKDRFGLSVNPKVTFTSPAPGDYETEKQVMKGGVTGAVFMAESKRKWLADEKKNPGPAFYKPMYQPKKKSFHLKPNNKWV